MHVTNTTTPNRAARRAQSAGRHRQVVTHRGPAVLVAAAAAAAGIALAPTAHADPAGQAGISDGGGQAGINSGGGQSGLTTQSPAPAPEIIPAQNQQYLPGYTASPTVQEYGYRSYESDYSTDSYNAYYDNTYYEAAPVAPEIVSDDPAAEVRPVPEPVPVPTVQKKVIRPTKAPENTVLVGGTAYARPDFIDPVLADQFNNTSQAIQADGANALMNAGLADAPQADRLAAGTAAGALTGAAVGFGAGMLPAAAITGAGAAIGAGLGVAATPVLTPAIIWGGPLGYVFVPGAAGLAGAGVGAAISTPIVATTTVIGALAGGALGATAAGGENAIIEEPAPAPAPEQAPSPAPQADIAAAVESVPGASKAIETAQNVIGQAAQQAPAAVDTVRDAVASDPVGAQVLDAVDTAVTQNAPAFDQARSTIDNAINAAFNSALTPA